MTEWILDVEAADAVAVVVEQNKDGVGRIQSSLTPKVIGFGAEKNNKIEKKVRKLLTCCSTFK